MELLIARNPDPDSALPYLLRVPIGSEGLLFRTKGTWPRTSALYCHPVPMTEWPAQPEILERTPLKACTRRGAAIDLVADRGREHRSQIVFTRGRGREMVFWQSPRTRKQARPHVTLPTARAAGIAELEIVIDTHERYPYKFAGQQVRIVRRGLPCGDYAVALDGRPVAAVERKSLADLVSSLTSGRLRFALGELAALPRAAVVVEDRYSQVFALDRVRPATVVDGLAELQVRWPMIPIVFCETRKLAEEWTYATSRPRAPGPRPRPPRCTGSASPPPRLPPHRAPTPRRRRHRPPRSAPGLAPTGSPSRIAGGCAPRSTKHGATPTHRDPHAIQTTGHARRRFTHWDATDDLTAPRSDDDTFVVIDNVLTAPAQRRGRWLSKERLPDSRMCNEPSP